uniref:G2 and S phase-expressed protein 1 N-terminal domain-containing protein n=1 Tax=Chelydra serpentina TaxID=8475 RepID=A0A8C3TDU1_CHESE
MGQYFFPDIKFITDEKFDFGLSSPSDSREEERVEEEEVRHIERGVAQRLDLNVQQREGVGRSRECLARWSPLSAEKLDEIVKEANRLAVQLERCSLREKENASAGPLGAARASPRSPRRETFVVKNSPVRALLPTVEPGKLLPLGKSPSPCARAAPPRLRHKLGSCSAGGERLRKKSTPSKGPALTPTKTPQSSKKVDGPWGGGGAGGPARGSILNGQLWPGGRGLVWNPGPPTRLPARRGKARSSPSTANLICCSVSGSRCLPGTAQRSCQGPMLVNVSAAHSSQ